MGAWRGRGGRRGEGGQLEGTDTRTAEEARLEGHIWRPADGARLPTSSAQLVKNSFSWVEIFIFLGPAE